MQIKTQLKKTLCAALIVAITMLPAWADPQNDYEENANQQIEIQNQLKALNEKIAGIKLETDNLLQSAAQIQEQLDDCEILLTTLDIRITNAEAQLDYKYQELEDQIHIYHMQIRYAEEYGSTSYWELIFSSKNIVELLNSLNLIEESIQYQQDTLLVIEKEIGVLEANIAELSAIRADWNYTARSLQSLQMSLYVQIEARISELTVLEQQSEITAFELDELRRVGETLLIRMNSANYDGLTDPTMLYEKYVVQTGEASRTPHGAKIVAAALQYVGGPYVWGGASPEVGFDCSGMMYYIYGQFGHNICRTARPQFKYNGRAVSYAELQAGDLVFFHPPGDPEISHVGMYIGGGMFIHAANSKKGIIVSSLQNGYYRTNFAGAKRII